MSREREHKLKQRTEKKKEREKISETKAKKTQNTEGDGPDHTMGPMVQSADPEDKFGGSQRLPPGVAPPSSGRRGAGADGSIKYPGESRSAWVRGG